MTYSKGGYGRGGGPIPHAKGEEGDILSYKVINTPLPLIHKLFTLILRGTILFNRQIVMDHLNKSPYICGVINKRI